MLFDWLHIAQETATTTITKPSFLFQAFPFVVVMGIFWMLVIGPQRRKDKERKAMLNGLAKGDDVVSSGGICGSIIGINEKTVVVKVSDDPVLKLEFLRSSIALVVPQETKES